MKVVLASRVVDFVRRLPPEPRNRLRRALRELVNERGDVKPDERTVALITGDGLKTIEALVDRAGPTMTIPPSLDAFAAQLESKK